MSATTICIDGTHFKDEQGRTLMLRGVNLGGSSKVPFHPNGATCMGEMFFDHRNVSFVGRPFPLDEADEHLARLRAWGLTFLRLLVTWEAVEHAGPGLYDEAYLDYLRAVVEKAGQHGMHLFIDPHQDVWSRFSGGDGAPGWTLEAVGFDMTRFAETGAAIVHATHGDPFPKMIWPTNGGKLAAATMFTLFFGGDDFAPRTEVDGEPVQAFLQRHYIAAMQQVAMRLRGLPQVVGYDTLNEPLPGYIGWRDLNAIGGVLSIGACPTPFQAMLLGVGLPQQVEVWEMGAGRLQRSGTQLLNATGARAWRPGAAHRRYDCVWRENGVWDFDAAGQPCLLRPDHFAQVNGRAVEFARDYYRPFAERFAAAIRAVDPRAAIFVEAEPTHPLPCPLPLSVRSSDLSRSGAGDAPGVVFAPHWYDALVLLTKRFSPFFALDVRARRLVIGPGAIRRSFAAQLALLKRGAQEQLGGVPTVLGEFGIPFDLDGKEAYRADRAYGDFGKQVRALDRSFQAVEANLLDCTLWNYTADNSNAHGDQWNDEDLSIFSRDQQADPADIHSGGRALQAAVRPYARATAGEPLRMSFDVRRRAFTFAFRHDPRVTAPTEVFVPNYQYPQGCRVQVSDGMYQVDREEQVLIYWHSAERSEHTIRIRP